MLENTIKVAMSDTFLDSMLALPHQPRNKTMKFLRHFRANPTSDGFHYETIANASDPNLRSIRLDQAYRAIVLKPEKGNVYVLLWVDHHDDAYAWAERKRVTVHPKTGSIQVLPVEVGEPVVEPSEAEEDVPGLLDDFRDRELRRFGVPDDMFPEVRACVTKGDLEKLKGRLPLEAWEALYWLSEGDTIEEVYRALMMEPTLDDTEDEEFDTEDFEAALERPGSKRHFRVLTDDNELELILNAPLDRWRIFLHPVQHKLVEKDVNGPIRVLGGAGTGKTVVAMHRAKWLIENVHTGPDDRILFTTFTRNLADDIRENLRGLCTPEQMRRIEVVNLDQWVSEFLQKQGYDHDIAYFDPRRGKLKELWEQALASRPADVDVPESFYREEWEFVIQDQAVESLRDYFKVVRTGRGQGLHRSARKKVWSVFETYRNLLAREGLRESPGAMRDARNLLGSKGAILPYRSVIVDEAQDLSAEAFKLIRAMIQPEQANDLFIVGDAHQRIYQHKVTLKHCGVNIVGRSHRLRINYRTTDEIRAFAIGVLEGVEVDDLDGGLDSVSGYMSLVHGEDPDIEGFETQADEIAAIAEWIGDDADKWPNVCVVARTKTLRDQYAEGLQKRGFKTHQVSGKHVDDRSKPGVRVATMHRVKGLEFERMVIAGMNEGVMPLEVAIESDDEAVQEQAEQAERALFYVSLTRAKRAVLVTGNGKLSPYISAGSP
jgi:superfamily I DNA/RNA helicase